MQNYELMYIIPMTLTVDEAAKVKEEITKALQDNGATIHKQDSLGKQKFAYPINKLSHGYYEVVDFELEPTKLIEIDSILKYSDDVVRYLLTKIRIKSEKELAAEQRLREKIAEQDQKRKSIFDEEEDESQEAPKEKKSKTVSKIKEKKEDEKVQIEDLDKKLDAILEGEDMLQ